jgi:signal recognition particle subunit SRP19
MRQQERAIIWPVYFDSTRTRKDGRRVAKNMAVPMPKASEVKEAADKLGLPSELVADVGHPKAPWLKTGMVLTKKQGSKNQTVALIAKQLSRMRSTPAPKQ